MTSQQMQACSEAEFLTFLKNREIELRVQDGKLRISAPTGALNDALKTELLRRKSMLLAAFAATHTLPSSNLTLAPLSFAQERLWLLERFHPGNFAYNIAESFQINGPVDAVRMQRSIDFVVNRQAILRTSFIEGRAGDPLQQVHQAVAVPLQIVDLEHLEPAAREERLQRMLRGISREPFELGTAPLVRFFLIRMAPEKYIVSINIHHIIADRWSMRVLYRELLSAYQAYAQGQEPALTPLSLQYAEYSRRERSFQSAQGLDSSARSPIEQLQYWKQQLSPVPDLPELPFRLGSATTRPFDGAMHFLEFTNEETVGLRQFARKHNASAYMVLLAAFAGLLHRYTGVEDVCIGSPVTERVSTATEGLIGLFVNTLVMRCRFDANDSFAHLLRSVRETVLDAQNNKEVPLQLILQELHPDGGVSAQPLFNTMFAFDAFMGGEAESGQLAVDPGIAKFDLTLQLQEGRDRMSGWFEFRTELFTPESIAKFSAAFRLLLQDAIQTPARQVSRLQILGEPEQTSLLQTLNQTEMAFPRHLTIHELFELQAERSPDAVAVIDGSVRMSYRDLNSMANRIAHGLLQHNLRAEAIVGVHLERSVEMIAALIGILKAGAAYLPLDTQYPSERLQIMVQDSSCMLALSSSEFEFATNTLVLSPATLQIQMKAADKNPGIAVSPTNLAYVIYTSGSTGRPKGVAIEHHSTVSFLEWAGKTFADVLQGTLASTSISFDLSIFEIFVPLVTGHTVILAQDILAFPALPAAAEVTLATTVPSAAAALLATGQIPSTLHAINLAGEALSTRLVDRLYAETSLADVNDLYGPTETTTYSTWNRRSPGRLATIGRPIANTRLYLVDRFLQLVPEGVPGELLIAGEGVARGYLGQPNLSAERFVSLLHLGEAGVAYRTGDRCRYQPDGTVEYLGRMDNQVKVRGFRIEVAEIESVLASHPAVRDAVVTARTDGDAGASLVGHVIMKDAATLDVTSLIAHQSNTLPGHMIVKNLVAIDDFPRTANGKVDRKQLGTLTLARPSPNLEQFLSDPLERELAAIWRENFSRTDIGVDDDFFQLGGHSLLALRIFAEIESKLGHKMMLSVLFQAPTIRKLAEWIRKNQTS